MSSGASALPSLGPTSVFLCSPTLVPTQSPSSSCNPLFPRPTPPAIAFTWTSSTTNSTFYPATHQSSAFPSAMSITSVTKVVALVTDLHCYYLCKRLLEAPSSLPSSVEPPGLQSRAFILGHRALTCAQQLKPHYEAINDM
mmetsp:Transcript_7739/g.10968  ORF Transcript_7739/g.10968 Transcript_7739/m.10968 type:complete len:141 (+) Transcript_7739:194-616(+)